MKISFFESPIEVAKSIADKKSEVHFDYDEISYKAHQDTFTIAKMTKIDLLNDIKNSLETAYKDGTTFKEWKEQITPTLKKKGWFGNTIVKNPKTGEEHQIYVGSRRLKTIFNTNMRMAYAKSRYQTQMQSTGEYFRYTAVLDNHTRPVHRRLHGTTLPKTDKYWDTNYPPNGWGCRCKVQVLTKSEVESKGITPLADGSMLQKANEKGFEFSPKTHNLDDVLKEKAKKLKCDKLENSDKNFKTPCEKIRNLEHERNLAIWQKGLNHAIDELLIKKNLKAPIAAFALGKLSKDIIIKSEEILKIKVQDLNIMGDKHGILHIRPARKGLYGQDLSIDELRKIVKVLAGNGKVSIDTKRKNIIFWFDDEKDKNKVNKLIVNLNYTLKKFGVTNYMVTAGKVDKSDRTQEYYIEIR